LSLSFVEKVNICAASKDFGELGEMSNAGFKTLFASNISLIERTHYSSPFHQSSIRTHAYTHENKNPKDIDIPAIASNISFSNSMASNPGT
jgi:hypothetical protein